MTIDLTHASAQPLEATVVAGLAENDRAFLRDTEQAMIAVARRLLGRPAPGGAGAVDKAGYHTLVRLEACGRTRLSDLATAMELDLSTVSRQVRILSDLGLIAREADPDDRRASLLELTAAGHDEIARQRRWRHALLWAALADWESADRAELLRLLRRLADDLAPGSDPGISPSATSEETR